MKKIFLPILVFVSALVIFSFKGDEASTPEKYSFVKINIKSPNDIQSLLNNDIDVEHYDGNIREGIKIYINENELKKLRSTGLSFEILIENTDEYFCNRPLPDYIELLKSKSVMESDNVSGFSYGSMGGYLTFAEIVQKLDSMRLQYPNLITQKFSIGTSTESRTLWAVKISDNPDQNESPTEPAVYFDALHHAREPMSMSILIYYMYWLLENYNTNAEAKYLIDNREIFFVPVVNPDGYEYNRSTNPNGGGMWRKNRRNNGGSYGVDLNRNYPYGWGLNSGSSGTPSSETYRGPFAASEPETQAVMNFTNQINPKISFSTHSYAGRYLNPYGYNDSTVSYDVYSEYSGDFAEDNNYLYGTVIEMLDYYSSGTTRDYLHSQGTYCWTPEVGGSGFWASQSEIIPVCSENLKPLKYLTMVAGPFVSYKNYSVDGNILPGNTFNLNIRIRNKGLTKIPQSGSFSVTVRSLTAGVTPSSNTITFDNDTLSARSNKILQQLITLPSNLTYLTNVKLEISVSQKELHNSFVTDVDTVSFIVGGNRVLFRDNADTTGISRWLRSGSGTLWDTSFIGYWDGLHSFTDSRYGNSKNSSTNYFTMVDTINLSGAVNPRLEFAAKWAIEDIYDYARLQITTNNGSSWTNIAGNYTKLISGQPSYSAVRSWVRERINLNSYIGQKVKFRFQYFTDAGVPGDGFYFDDFRIVDYRDTLTSITQNSNVIPEKFALHQNYPNPFNPITSIRFDIPKATHVRLTVFDILGSEVNILINQNMISGSYSIWFDALHFSSGLYFYKIETPEFSSVRKMMVVK